MRSRYEVPWYGARFSDIERLEALIDSLTSQV